MAEPLQGLAGLQVELDGADVLEVHLADGADDRPVDELHHQLVGPVVRLAVRQGGGVRSPGEANMGNVGTKRRSRQEKPSIF